MRARVSGRGIIRAPTSYNGKLLRKIECGNCRGSLQRLQAVHKPHEFIEVFTEWSSKIVKSNQTVRTVVQTDWHGLEWNTMKWNDTSANCFICVFGRRMHRRVSNQVHFVVIYLKLQKSALPTLRRKPLSHTHKGSQSVRTYTYKCFTPLCLFVLACLRNRCTTIQCNSSAKVLHQWLFWHHKMHWYWSNTCTFFMRNTIHTDAYMITTWTPLVHIIHGLRLW